MRLLHVLARSMCLIGLGFTLPHLPLRGAVLSTSGADMSAALALGRPTTYGTWTTVATGVKAFSTNDRSTVWIDESDTLWGCGLHIGSPALAGTFDLNRPTVIAQQVKSVHLDQDQLVFITLAGDLYFIGRDPFSFPFRSYPIDRPLKLDSQVSQVAAADWQTAWVKTDGTVWRFGMEIKLRSDGTEERTWISSPRQIAAEATRVFVNFHRIAYLDRSNAAWALGPNASGELGVKGQPYLTTPRKIATGVRDIIFALERIHFIDTENQLWSMGKAGPASGVANSDDAEPFTTPQKVFTRVKKATASTSEALHVLRHDGSLWIAGNSPTFSERENPLGSEGGFFHFRNEIADFSLGTECTALLSTSGGFSGTGEIGLASDYRPLTEVITSGISSVRAEQNAVWILRQDGRLQALGYDRFGQFGQGPFWWATPQPVAGDFIAADTAFDVTAAIDRQGRLWHWGDNFGQWKGTGTPYTSPLPTLLASNAVQVAVAPYGVGFLDAAGNFYLVSDIFSTPMVTPPYPTLIKSGITRIWAADEDPTFALLDEKKNLWGFRDYGAFDPYLGIRSPSEAPLQKIAEQVADVALGRNHSAYVTTTGELRVSGYNTAGELGPGANYTDPPKVYQALLATGVKAVAVTNTATFWVTNAGEIKGIGDMLFGGEIVGADKIVAGLRNLVNPRSIKGAGERLVIVAADGRVWNVGNNLFGLFGDGTTQSSVTPVLLTSTPVEVFPSHNHTAFLFAESAPIIAKPPVSTEAVLGQPVTLSVAVAGPYLSIQWYKDDTPLAGQTGPSLTLPSFSASEVGVYSVVVTNAKGSTRSSGAVVSQASRTERGRPLNLSVLGLAGKDERTLIGGFNLSGTGQKRILIRAAGPALAAYQVAGVADPALRLVDQQGKLLAENSDWSASLAETFAAVGAFAWTPGSKDAALLIDLPPGLYSVLVDNPGPEASTLIEVYDVSKNTDSSLTNLSCRMLQNASTPLIVGVVLDRPAPLLLRNGGPSLRTLGLASGASDTQLTVYDTKGTKIAENDNYPNDLLPRFQSLGAYQYPKGSKDAALLLPAGVNALTLHCTTKAESGVGICEVYLAE